MSYLKAHLAALGALVVALLTTVQQAGHLDRANIVQVAIAVLGVVAAYFISNTAGGVRKYAQAIISSVVVVLQAAAPFVVDGHITYAQCVIVGVTVVQAVAVYWTVDTVAATNVIVNSTVGKHEAAAVAQDGTAIPAAWD